MEEKLLMPENIEKLQKNLDEATDRTEFISGGTDILLSLKKNGFGNRKLIDLSGVAELKYIIEREDNIVIGSGTTLSTIIDNNLINTYAPMLKKAADCVGSTQIRNAATIGGNIANAFAGADLIPPLIALEAELLLLGKLGSKRVLNIKEFILGNRKNALKVGEIIFEISFKKSNSIQYFGKIGSRSRVTISKLNMAANVVLEGKKIKSSNVVFGALGTTAFSSNKVEKFLFCKELESLDFADMSVVFTNIVDEAIPNRESRIYKRDAITSLAMELYKILKMEVEV